MLDDNYFINKRNRNWNSEELEYLQNRYSDSSCIKETLYRINNNIEIRPVCQKMW